MEYQQNYTNFQQHEWKQNNISPRFLPQSVYITPFEVFLLFEDYVLVETRQGRGSKPKPVQLLTHGEHQENHLIIRPSVYPYTQTAFILHWHKMNETGVRDITCHYPPLLEELDRRDARDISLDIGFRKDEGEGCHPYQSAWNRQFTSHLGTPQSPYDRTTKSLAGSMILDYDETNFLSLPRRMTAVARDWSELERLITPLN